MNKHFFHNSLAVEDTTVGIMGNLSGLLYCFLIAFARSSEWMYVGNGSCTFYHFINYYFLILEGPIQII